MNVKVVNINGNIKVRDAEMGIPYFNSLVCPLF